MTEVVCDASIVLKWFHSEGEAEAERSRELLELHRSGDIVAHVLGLTHLEIGNVLIRSLGCTAKKTTVVLDALDEICSSLTPTSTDIQLAAELAARHNLTFYDAIYAATAQSLSASLATADRELIDAGLGYTPSYLVSNL